MMGQEVRSESPFYYFWIEDRLSRSLRRLSVPPKRLRRLEAFASGARLSARAVVRSFGCSENTGSGAIPCSMSVPKLALNLRRRLLYLICVRIPIEPYAVKEILKTRVAPYRIEERVYFQEL